MTDQLNQRKRPRQENKQIVMSWTPPVNALTNLHSENPPRQQEHSSAITRIHPLRLRAMGTNVKLPHIYRDYHVHIFDSANMSTISFMAVGVDIILVVYFYNDMVLFRRHGDEISPVIWDNNRSRINCDVEGMIISVCYNEHDNSFLIVYQLFEIVSLKIVSIQAEAGRNPMVVPVFPGESRIQKWDVDIPMCRAMIHNPNDRAFKFFELKEYKLLFTIPDLGGTHVGSFGSPLGPYFKSLTPGNMDMLMYEKISVSENGIPGVQLRIYSKVNGALQKEIFVPQPSPEIIEFVALCGSNTLLMQQHLLEMEVVEMSSENWPVSIKRKNTNIRAACDPYYLHKRSQFIFYAESRKIHVCNLQGEILVTLKDHPLIAIRTFKDVSFFVDSYISNSQDILISLGLRVAPSGLRWIYTVTVSSIVTGHCLARITSEDPNCSQIRKAALRSSVNAFVYDERTHQFFTGNSEGVAAVWSNKFHNDVGNLRTLPQV